jgi:hypothetical protein
MALRPREDRNLPQQMTGAQITASTIVSIGLVLLPIPDVSCHSFVFHVRSERLRIFLVSVHTRKPEQNQLPATFVTI